MLNQVNASRLTGIVRNQKIKCIKNFDRKLEMKINLFQSFKHYWELWCCLQVKVSSVLNVLALAQGELLPFE